MATVWTSTSGGITLSDSAHKVESTSGIQGAIAGPVKLLSGGGKWYLEFLCEFATDTCVLAIADSRYTTPAVGPPVAETYLFVNNGFTTCWGNNGTSGTVTTGQVDMAVDLDAVPNRFYHRINNGVWQFSGNPAAGTGGLTPGGAGNPVTHVKPVVYLGATGRDCTINCGDRAFINTPPVGFLGWDAVSPDGLASGVTFTVTTSLIDGVASIDGAIAGQVFTTTVSLIAGTAGTSGDAAGVTLTTTVSLIAGTPSAEAIDGTQIYETTFGVGVSNRYQEADYDSMFSKGRRIQNGLITAGDYGWTSGSGTAGSAFDNNLGAAAGNGPSWGGPYGGTLWFHSIVPLDIQGFRFIGSDEIAAESQGIWEFKGAFGIGEQSSESYAQEFDAFIAQQGPGVTASGHTFTEYLTTPRLPILYDRWEMTFVAGARSGSRLCNDLDLKISHSNLDGGDRRSTNGRPEKRCVFTMSADWTYSTSLIDPQDALFDGLHFYDNAGDSSKNGHQAAIGRAVGAPIGNPLSVVGAWLQFVFPRPVIMQRLMFVTFNTDGEVYDSGDEPTIFGRWHWEISKNSGTSWAQVGTSWSFCEGGDMVAPRDLSAFVIDRSDAGVGADGVTHWRMVLEEGPAFGYAEILDQIVFDLYDATGLAPLYTVNFTDDIDNEPVVFVPGDPGSPYVVAFSDGSDDKLTFEFENTPNPVLTVHFEDGATFDTWSDLYPSVVVQTTLVTTGR